MGSSRLGSTGVSNQLARPPNSNEYGEEWLARRPYGFRQAWGSTHNYEIGQGSDLAILPGGTTLINGLDKIRVTPNVFPVAGTLSKLTFYIRAVAAGTGSKIRLAIYDSTILTGHGTYPGNRVYQSGEIDVSSTATAPFGGPWNETMVTLFPNIPVTKNQIYWCGWIYNDAFRADNVGGNISVFVWQNHRIQPMGFPNSTHTNLYGDARLIMTTSPNSLATVRGSGQGQALHSWASKISGQVFGNGFPTIFPTAQVAAINGFGSYPIGSESCVNLYVGAVNSDGLEQTALGVFYKMEP